MFDGMNLVQRMNARGTLNKVFDETHLDLTTPWGAGLFPFSAPWPRTNGIASPNRQMMDGGSNPAQR